MVVFNAGRPVRCEAVLPAHPHGTTPAGRACRGQFNAGRRGEDAETVVRHRRAALEVKQRGVPGVADLAGEQADAISFCLGREQWIDKAETRVAEVCPITLSFQAKNPLTGLPTVAELAAHHASGPIAAAVSEVYASRIKETQTAMALAPAAIAADVKAAPVVDWCEHRGPLVDRPRRRSGCGGGSRRHAQCHQTNCTQQKLLHHHSPVSRSFAISRSGVLQAVSSRAHPISESTVTDSKGNTVAQKPRTATCVVSGTGGSIPIQDSVAIR